MYRVNHELRDHVVRTLEAGATGLEIPAKADCDNNVAAEGKAVCEPGQRHDPRSLYGRRVVVNEEPAGDTCGESRCR